MALKIQFKKGEYSLQGRLCSSHSHEIFQFFKSKLNFHDHLTINLAGIDDLDLAAAIMLEDLKKEAKRRNKPVEILLGMNKKILGPFRVLNPQMYEAA